MKAAIIDLQIGRGVKSIASYVSMTRIRTRYDLLIFRDFDREVFTQGDPEGPALLLRVQRGEKIDWKKLKISMCLKRNATEHATQFASERNSQSKNGREKRAIRIVWNA